MRNVGNSSIFKRTTRFKSLLYEACGRIVNPIYGSAGLLWSGSWQLCQNAVEAILHGSPITQIALEKNNGSLLKAYDIRYITKDENSGGSSELHRVKARCQFKRSVGKGKRVESGSGPARRNLVLSSIITMTCRAMSRL
ncbi:hypothetical protein L6452_15839 [Arctium lappa]|uniref:Uncharacterized protein n=1 Tax=Arctium lappa TaxID=4217 RepID=A0ACB9CPW9_ARCLA|nr:hypothetical protein L6452_15839 [Arctium lappa]